MIKKLALVLSILLISHISLLAKTTVVIVGDSLTAGFGVDRFDAYPTLVEEILVKKGYDVKIINAGISGSTSASAHSRLKWYLKSKPQIVLIALGANDGLRGVNPQKMRDNLAKAIEFALSKNIAVMLAGMKIPPNYGKKYTDDFESSYATLSKKYNLKLIPFILQGVAARPYLNLPDGIHPNTRGHKIIANTVVNHLEPLLKK